MDTMAELKPKGTPATIMQTFLAHPAAPVALVMISDLVFTSMDGFSQLLQLRGMPTGQVVFIRMLSSCILCGAYLLLYDRPALKALFGPSAPAAWFRALAASTSTAGCYGAVGYVPLSIFMTLYHLRPFPTALACYIFLKERCSRVQIIACIISFSAVILVVQPFKHRPTVGEGTAWAMFLGVSLTLMSALGGAADIVLCRQVGDRVTWVAMLFAFATVGSFVGVGYAWITGTGFQAIPDPVDWLMLTSLSLSGFIAQMTMLLALQRASGMKVSLLGYFQIIWAVLWQTTVRSDPPNLLQILGMAVIVTAGSWAIVRGGSDAPQAVDKEEESQIPLLISHTTPITGTGDGYLPVSTHERDGEILRARSPRMSSDRHDL